MAATMLFSGCTPNISEYAARAQQAGKSFWEGETTDAMAQDSDAAATADDETSVAGETQNVSTGTDTAAATNEWQDSAAATDDEIQGGTTATGGKAQHGNSRQRDACDRRNADRHCYRICGSNSSSNSGPDDRSDRLHL